MKKTIKQTLMGALSVLMLAGVAGTVIAPLSYAAGNCDHTKGLTGAVDENCSKGEGQATNLFSGNDSIVNTVINTMLFIAGILSVIMIIWSGIRYVTAHGDKNQVESAKSTLIYAIVGLILSIIAYAVVQWISGLWTK